MDRFLESCRIHKNQLQLLGTACMLLASKLREPKPLSAEMLVFYTDHSITLQDLWVSENVLSYLNHENWGLKCFFLFLKLNFDRKKAISSEFNLSVTLDRLCVFVILRVTNSHIVEKNVLAPMTFQKPLPQVYCGTIIARNWRARENCPLLW